MAYRRSDRVQARLAATRERIVHAALDLVASDGWSAATVAAVAASAGVATGSVYSHFAGKDELIAEVFRTAARRELEHVEAAAAMPGPVHARIERAVETFAQRALRGGRLAYALLAEPAAAVEPERLAFRRDHRAVFADVLRDGVAAGELAPHDVDLVAAALVGAIGEALVGPLSPAASHADPDDLVTQLVALSHRCLPIPEVARVHA